MLILLYINMYQCKTAILSGTTKPCLCYKVTLVYQYGILIEGNDAAKAYEDELGQVAE